MNGTNRTAFLLIVNLWLPLLFGDPLFANDSTCDFWQRVVTQASQAVDGHFVVEMKLTSKTEQGSQLLRTTIEYWVRGSDLRFDVKDQEGRNFNSQVVLKDAGQTVLDNSDRSNTSIVVSQSERGSKMATSQRANWLYFQPLLGRYPFSPLALYEESFQDLKALCETKTGTDVVEGDQRVVTFTHSNGRSMRFSFRGSELNPHKIEALRADGSIAKRIVTNWEPALTQRNHSIAKSGVFEAFAASGAVHEQCEWTHILAEDLQAASDPFNWKEMKLNVGKKLIVSDSNQRTFSGGYWDGNTFSATPLSVGNPQQHTTLFWLCLFVLAVGIVLFVLKLRVYLKGSLR